MSHCSILGNSFKSDDHIGTYPISHTTCHLYRKHELVKLCELVQELDLEKITPTNDYELSQVNRRTV
jgi:hypothetical protein